MKDKYYEIIYQSRFIIINESIKNGKLKKDKKGLYRYTETIPSPTKKSIRVEGSGTSPENVTNSFIKSYKKRIEIYENQNTNCHSIADVANEWYDNMILHSYINETTKKDYKRCINKEIIPHLGASDISKLKEKDYNSFMNQYAGQGEAKLRFLKITLNQILKFAYKNDYINRNDYEIKIPDCIKIKKRDALPENILTLLVKLFNNGDRYAEDFIILLTTGMRIKEATNLKYSDIDFEIGFIKINESKTQSGIREIPIPDFVLKILKNRINEASKQNYSTEFVFRQKINPEKTLTVAGFEENFNSCIRNMDILNGAEIYRNQITKSTLGGIPKKRGKKSSGLKYPYTPYQLRHTYASLLNAKNINNNTIKTVMGHSKKDDVTQNNYIHTTTKQNRIMLTPFFKTMEIFIKNPESNISDILYLDLVA